MFMKRVFRGLLALSAIPLAAQDSPTPPTFFEKVDVDVVNIEVFVADKDGRPKTTPFKAPGDEPR